MDEAAAFIPFPQNLVFLCNPYIDLFAAQLLRPSENILQQGSAYIIMSVTGKNTQVIQLALLILL